MTVYGLNVFEQSFKHLNAYGIPLAIKHLDSKKVMLIAGDTPIIVNTQELIEVLNSFEKEC